MKILVLERDPLELLGHLQRRVVLDPEQAEHLVRALLHHLGARVEVLVDPVAEAHEAERVVLVLGLGDELRDAVGRADLAQHLQAGLVRAAMRRAPEAGDAGRDAGEGVGPEDEARRTVEVEAFCSWSAWSVKIRSIARLRIGSTW
jgi:hypothetical protein